MISKTNLKLRWQESVGSGVTLTAKWKELTTLDLDFTDMERGDDNDDVYYMKGEWVIVRSDDGDSIWQRTSMDEPIISKEPIIKEQVTVKDDFESIVVVGELCRILHRRDENDGIWASDKDRERFIELMNERYPYEFKDGDKRRALESWVKDRAVTLIATAKEALVIV